MLLKCESDCHYVFLGQLLHQMTEETKLNEAIVSACVYRSVVLLIVIVKGSVEKVVDGWLPGRIATISSKQGNNSRTWLYHEIDDQTR